MPYKRSTKRSTKRKVTYKRKVAPKKTVLKLLDDGLRWKNQITFGSHSLDAYNVNLKSRISLDDTLVSIPLYNVGGGQPSNPSQSRNSSKIYVKHLHFRIGMETSMYYSGVVRMFLLRNSANDEIIQAATESGNWFQNESGEDQHPSADTAELASQILNTNLVARHSDIYFDKVKVIGSRTTALPMGWVDDAPGTPVFIGQQTVGSTGKDFVFMDFTVPINRVVLYEQSGDFTENDQLKGGRFCFGAMLATANQDRPASSAGVRILYSVQTVFAEA